MSFDVNRIIIESLQELNEQQKTDTGMADQFSIKNMAKATADKVKKEQEDAAEIEKNMSIGRKNIAVEKSNPMPDKISPTYTQAQLDAAEKEGYERGEFNKAVDHAQTDTGKLKRRVDELEGEKKTAELKTKNDELDQAGINASKSIQKAADVDAAELKTKNDELDQAGINASKSIQKAADVDAAETAAETTRKAARHASGLDSGVDTHLYRAINRTGQALGIKKALNDKEAGETGVGTHLLRAGKRAIQAVREGDPYAIGTGAGAAGIAAGLGALSLVKKLRSTKKATRRA